jgi:hypothetical protein
MRSLSAERNALFVRTLVTTTSRTYREVLALFIRRHRPDFEVLLGPPESLDGESERFWPHVLVQDADEDGLLLGLPDGVLCRIHILKAGRLDATIELNGTASEVRDVRFEDVFEALEKAEGLSKGDGLVEQWIAGHGTTK